MSSVSISYMYSFWASLDIANIVDDGTHIAAAQKKKEREMPSNNLVKENLDLKSLAMHPSAKKLHFRPKLKKKKNQMYTNK